MNDFKIPEEIKAVTTELEKRGFLAYMVGGCVRDLLMGRRPKDWDITTNATPEKIIDIFSKTFYANSYGTVTVINENSKDNTLKNIEVTPFRIETKYSDKRHPDAVKYARTLEEDLSRRDFNINAIAYDISKGHIIDPHKGQKDIKDKILRTVGTAKERLTEDALRILRAVRLATELNFICDKELENVLRETSSLIKDISFERVRDELVKIISSKEPKRGFELLKEYKIIEHIIPELLEGVDIDQNQAHAYTVWEHNLRTVQHSADRNFSFHVKLAALLHDVAKPHTKGWNDKKNDATFYGHDVVGARMTKKILERLKFSRETIEIVSKLVRYHLFFSDVDKITLSAVRRIVKNVGKEYIWDLMDLRACDRIGTGRPKEHPYRLRKYQSMVEEVMRDPITVGMLAIDGEKIMNVTKLKPGPKIGYILHALLEEVLDDPKLNTSEYLEKRANKLSSMSEKELIKLGERGKEKKDKIEETEIGEIRKKHWVE